VSAQGRETLLKVQCCDSDFDENPSLPKVGAVREKGNARKDWSGWCGVGRKIQEASVVLGLCVRARALAIRHRAVTDYDRAVTELIRQ
jgi:hypothetical protein